MSLNTAMTTGVSGLYAYSSALSTTSSNLTNSSTTGYKGSSTEFSTLLSSALSSSGTTGINVTTEQNVSAQGDLTATSTVTDLAVSGKGFFVTSTDEAGTNVEYTRAGDFSTNKSYELVNGTGSYLLGYGITTNSDGTTTTGSTLSTIKLDKSQTSYQASSTINVSGNLESTDSSDTTYSKDTTFYDSQGAAQTASITYTKSSTANEWNYSVDYGGSSDNVDSTTLDSGTVTFNTDGSLASVTSDYGTSTDGTTSFAVNWSSSSGLSAQTLSMNFGTIGGTDGLGQVASTSTAKGTADGASVGTISDYAIGTDGTVTATYSNGLTRNLYSIPLATFANSDGLTAVSGTAYVVSDASGKANVVTANTTGAGKIESENLESSTVDTSTELTDLITTQRAYSSCAKIVNAASSMMETLVNLGT